MRRYERATPGELVHVDIKKLGNIPDGGGWRAGANPRDGTTGRPTATLPAAAQQAASRIWVTATCTAIDDYSRLAYSEILPDETSHTATAFWGRAQAFFTATGITVQRVMTDNGSCYRAFAWRDALTAAGITHKRTRPCRPQTNGKVGCSTYSASNGQTPTTKCMRC